MESSLILTIIKACLLILKMLIYNFVIFDIPLLVYLLDLWNDDLSHDKLRFDIIFL